MQKPEIEVPSTWVSVGQASEATRVPARTVYSWVEDARVPSKQRDGKTIVDLTAVQKLSAARSAACAQLQTSTNTSAALPEVERARARVEMVRAATEEALATRSLLDAEDALRRAQQEAGHRQLLLESQLRTNELELRERESTLEGERRSAEASARVARERVESERRQREVREERERRRNEWIAEWCARIADAARETFGPASVPSAIGAVRTALGALEPETPDSVVRSLLSAELQAALSDLIAEREEQARRQKREELIEWVVVLTTLYYPSPAIESAVRAAAREAAKEIDPFASDAFSRISHAACAARDQVYGVERERAEEEETKRKWVRLFDGLEDRVDRWRATTSTPEERKEALEALRALFENRPAWMTPAQFERERERVLDEHRARINTRLEWEAMERRLWDLVWDGLARNATPEDRRAAEADVTRLLGEMRESGRSCDDFRMAARRLLDDRRVALSRAS